MSCNLFNRPRPDCQASIRRLTCYVISASELGVWERQRLAAAQDHRGRPSGKHYKSEHGGNSYSLRHTDQQHVCIRFREKTYFMLCSVESRFDNKEAQTSGDETQQPHSGILLLVPLVLGIGKASKIPTYGKKTLKDSRPLHLCKSLTLH